MSQKLEIEGTETYRELDIVNSPFVFNAFPLEVNRVL